MTDFSNVKSIVIPEGEVAVIARGTEILWQKSRLPLGFQEVEYIETNGTQYIKTGVTTTGNTRVVAKMMCLEKNSAGRYAYLFASNSLLFSFRIHWSNGYPYNTYGSTTSKTFYVDGVGNVLNINYGSGVSTVNDYKKDVGTAEFTDGELWVFASAGAPTATRGKGRLWEFKVYEGETLVRDYTPCINSDGEVGLYDLVTNTFFANAGTGEFSYAAKSNL